MRDQHRQKQDLVNELVGLRKQLGDLREAMAERRRVEDALRSSDQLLRLLLDGSPVGLALVRPDGAPLLASAPLARSLGYQSPAEFQSVGSVLGVFAGQDEQARILGGADTKAKWLEARFRCRDGGTRQLRVAASEALDAGAIVLAVLEPVNAALPGDMRSA